MSKFVYSKFKFVFQLNKVKHCLIARVVEYYQVDFQPFEGRQGHGVTSDATTTNS
jgi:hypothetical protein